jgi:uncharacterized membrane protein YtjA (UPF0391 family)
MGLLGWALIFLVVAVIAAAFGFGGIASVSAGIARTLFLLFLIVFVVLVLMDFLGTASWGPRCLRNPGNLGTPGSVPDGDQEMIPQYRFEKSLDGRIGFAVPEAPLFPHRVQPAGHHAATVQRGVLAPDRAARPAAGRARGGEADAPPEVAFRPDTEKLPATADLHTRGVPESWQCARTP